MTAPAGPTLVTIGHITANAEWIVTPAGTWRLRDVNVTAVDQTSTTTHTPTWAIVFAIVLVWFFLLSLLFLLAREVRLHGSVAVHIAGPDGRAFTEQIPVATEWDRTDVFDRTLFVQTLIGAAQQRP